MTNSNVLFYLLILFFVSSGLVLGFVELKLSNTTSSVNEEQIDTDINIEQTSNSNFVTGVASIGTVLIGILKMAFWSFGSLPLIVELLLIQPFRILFYVLLVKIITGGS